MGIGGPALSTNQRREDIGATGILSTAEGVGENPAGVAVLGRDFGSVGPDPSDVTTPREIYFGDGAGTVQPIAFLAEVTPAGRTEIFFDPSSRIILQNSQSFGFSRLEIQFNSLDLNVQTYLYWDDNNNSFGIECGAADASIFFFPDSGTLSVGVNSEKPGTKFYIDGNAWVRDDLRAKFLVQAYGGATVNLTAEESREILSNVNTPGGGMTFTLPLNAVTGTEFTFSVITADPVIIQAQPGETIIYGPLETTAGGFIQSSARGSVLRLACLEPSTWYVISAVGTWNF